MFSFTPCFQLRVGNPKSSFAHVAFLCVAQSGPAAGSIPGSLPFSMLLLENLIFSETLFGAIQGMQGTGGVGWPLVLFLSRPAGKPWKRTSSGSMRGPLPRSLAVFLSGKSSNPSSAVSRGGASDTRHRDPHLWGGLWNPWMNMGWAVTMMSEVTCRTPRCHL